MINQHLICFIVSIASVFGKEYVQQFTDEDFDTRISEVETTLVMFYAPWCGHCKKLKPEYEKAASDLFGSDPPIGFAKVDCTEGGSASCSRFGVSGYPTLKIFRNGNLLKDYKGPREAAGIVKYMKSQVGPSSQDLKSVADFEKFIGKDEAVVVGFFPKESDLKAEFLKAADQNRETYAFAHSTSKDVLENQGITEESVVLFRPKHMHNKFEDNSVTYDGSVSKDSISKWIGDNIHGLVGHRHRENTQSFKNPLVVAYYSVDYAKNPKGTNYWRNRILKVAKNFAGKFYFAISTQDEFQHELNEFGFDYVSADKPLVLARSVDNKKYILKEDFSVESFETFLTLLEANELEPYLKSGPIPDDNSGPVTVAVGKNFDQVVTNNDKDTLIEFYAPWCGHCKKLSPIFDELGEKMKNEDVAIVKMDATINDVSGPFEVRGYPTLYWAPKNSKSNPVRYEGGRELEDFIKYIAKHATSELKGYDRKGKPKKEEL